MKSHEVGALNFGDEFLPWLKRIDNVIEQQSNYERKIYYAKKILERLKVVSFIQADFMVDSEKVLGKDPDRPSDARFLFPTGFMFFGKLQDFGYLERPAEVRGLTVIFNEAEPIDYMAPVEDQEDFSVISFEAPVRGVTTLLPAAA